MSDATKRDFYTISVNRQTYFGMPVLIHAPAHPRGVRPGAVARQYISGKISIHAPAWGATGMSSKSRISLTISIHAPAWGATSIVFNVALAMIISIHAPAWGATIHSCTMESAFGDFNPRTRVGCDEPFMLGFGVEIQFQSTHPRGVRLLRCACQGFFDGISIHAPAWGATQLTSSAPSAGVFQSTHPRGVRLLALYDNRRAVFISIHAPAWGATAAQQERACQR